MSDGLAALFWGVITFSLLVVVHEGGHFVAARLFGVKVHEFMVGLPGPAVRFHGKKTTYGITAIPLGGYVRIAGMEPGPEEPLLGPALAAITAAGTGNAFTVASALGIDEKAADSLLLTLADWDAIVAVKGDEYSYTSRFAPEEAESADTLLDRARSVTYRSLATWKRVVVLSMGVILNLITAVLVFTVVLSVYGYPKETGVLSSVGEGSAAQQAGIVAGDRITALDGEKLRSFQDLVDAVAQRQPGETASVSWVHQGEQRTARITLGRNPQTGNAMLGVRPQTELVRPGIAGSLLMSFNYLWLTFIAILGFFNPDTFAVSVSQSSSVIGAAYFAADAAKSGPLDYAWIIALLSLSLGAINILPIPPLDGGKIALEFVERLRGRPLPKGLSVGLSASGALLLFALIGYLMYQDIVRIVAS